MDFPAVLIDDDDPQVGMAFGLSLRVLSAKLFAVRNGGAIAHQFQSGPVPGGYTVLHVEIISGHELFSRLRAARLTPSSREKELPRLGVARGEPENRIIMVSPVEILTRIKSGKIRQAPKGPHCLRRGNRRLQRFRL